MNHEAIMEWCLCHTGAEASSPFGPQSVVFKVGGKLFAVLSLDVARINLKCDPAYAEELRAQYDAVEPGWHMNKKHWNSVYWDRQALRDNELMGWIKESYLLVRSSLPKRIQKDLTELGAA